MTPHSRSLPLLPNVLRNYGQNAARTIFGNLKTIDMFLRDFLYCAFSLLSWVKGHRVV